MIIQIAAMGRNRTIGNQGDLPWDIPEDMAFFKNTTKGKPCVFGRKTFEAVGHPLPQRLNVIVSREAQRLRAEHADKLKESWRQMELWNSPERKSGWFPTVVLFAENLTRALDLCREYKHVYGDDIYICGGGEVYGLALPMSDRLLLTEIEADYPGDAFFPEVDPKQFQCVATRSSSVGDLHFHFKTYDRKRS